MNDLLQVSNDDSKGMREDVSVEVQEFREDHNSKLISYNEDITTLDEDYTSLKPRFEVILRLFAVPMEKNEKGLYKPNTVIVKAPTQSGFGYAGLTESPWSFGTKAIVVAIPEGLQGLSPGDIVALDEAPVQARTMGKGDEAIVMINNYFIHPDERNKYSPLEIPQDPSDKNYGYIKKRDHEIPVIVNKV